MDKESGCKSSSNLLQSDFSRNASVFRVLVVEDHEPFRRFVCSMLEQRPELLVICAVSDGLEAVQKAEELRPDLILLDIGLPTLNGMEAARRIRRLSPDSKILFLSQESSADVVEEAFRVGAMGYVTKVRVASELLNAVEAVCQGKRFVGYIPTGHNHRNAAAEKRPRAPRADEIPVRHEVQFYRDEISFLESWTIIIKSALNAGDTAIVLATGAHLKDILQRLPAHCVDSAAASEERRYISLDVAEVLPTIMDANGPNRESFLSRLGSVVRHAEAAAELNHKKVVVLGEMVAVLCAEGRLKAAIEVEQLWNELARTNDFHLCCAYPMTEELKGSPYATICAEHSTVLPAAESN
jgi:DNA-binding NarL/FixJ family response regulator